MKLELNTNDTLLVVIDVQERLAPAMNAAQFGRMTANLGRLGAAAPILGVPAMVTEQYPKGLGPTVPAVQAAFEGATPFAKTAFSAARDDAIAQAIDEHGLRNIVIAGMETHICVFQSARDLIDKGHTVHVLADAVASRTDDNYTIGLDLIREAGGIVTSTEVVLFDLLKAAGSDAFKAISKLVK